MPYCPGMEVGYVGSMATIRRLTDSCVIVTTDSDATLFDPGFHTFDYVDLSTIGDVSRVFITHEHADHVKPEFVRWLIDRKSDLTVYTNRAVVELLATHDIEATSEVPADTSVEDVAHERLPTGATPPNRAFTINDVFTHPGDSHQPQATAPVLALPLAAPWTSTTAAVEFARRLRPAQVVPIHDYFMTEGGRQFFYGLAGGVLAKDGIELVALDWGGSHTI